MPLARCWFATRRTTAAARIDLQLILNRSKPATLWAVLDEVVLHRRVGSEEIMQRQLAHLLEQGERPHIGIQVVPARSGANAGHVGGFTIASVEGAADVLLRNSVEDVTTDQCALLLKAHAIFDRVRSEALPRTESLELIAKVAEQCKV